MREAQPGFKTDWRQMPLVLTAEAAKAVEASGVGVYQGMNVYGSYDDRGKRDASLRKWAMTVLDTFPGVQVSLVPRQRKKTGPGCPSCHEIVQHCPECGADMRGTEEKGVDTRIVTDMISLGWEQSYDVAVLVSSDRDFVPVAEYLQTKGIKVIHGAFPARGSQLTQKCWGSFSLPSLSAQFSR